MYPMLIRLSVICLVVFTNFNAFADICTGCPSIPDPCAELNAPYNNRYATDCINEIGDCSICQEDDDGDGIWNCLENDWPYFIVFRPDGSCIAINRDPGAQDGDSDLDGVPNWEDQFEGPDSLGIYIHPEDSDFVLIPLLPEPDPNIDILNSINELIEELDDGNDEPWWLRKTDGSLYEDKISVFPNPSNEHFYIKVEANTSGVLRVYDAVGSFVKLIEINRAMEIITLSELSKGVYTLSFEIGESKIVRRIIKSN